MAILSFPNSRRVVSVKRSLGRGYSRWTKNPRFKELGGIVYCPSLYCAVFKLKVKESLQHTYNANGEEAQHHGHDGSEKKRNWQEEQDSEEARSWVLHTSRETLPLEEEHRVKDILRGHKAFVRKQMKLAEQYMEKKCHLSSVSSKHSVHTGNDQSSVDSDDAHGGAVVRKKPAVEGRGARTVPSAVKNRRRKLKKRRAKERGRT